MAAQLSQPESNSTPKLSHPLSFQNPTTGQSLPGRLWHWKDGLGSLLGSSRIALPPASKRKQRQQRPLALMNERNLSHPPLYGRGTRACPRRPAARDQAAAGPRVPGSPVCLPTACDVVLTEERGTRLTGERCVCCTHFLTVSVQERNSVRQQSGKWGVPALVNWPFSKW